MANSTKEMVQVLLVNRSQDEQRILTTWLENDKRIKEGVNLTLKEYGTNCVWHVNKVFGTASFNEINHHGWDNNNYDKHEGLGL